MHIHTDTIFSSGCGFYAINFLVAFLAMHCRRPSHQSMNDKTCHDYRWCEPGTATAFYWEIFITLEISRVTPCLVFFSIGMAKYRVAHNYVAWDSSIFPRLYGNSLRMSISFIVPVRKKIEKKIVMTELWILSFKSSVHQCFYKKYVIKILFKLEFENVHEKRQILPKREVRERWNNKLCKHILVIYIQWAKSRWWLRHFARHFTKSSIR